MGRESPRSRPQEARLRVRGRNAASRLARGPLHQRRSRLAWPLRSRAAAVLVRCAPTWECGAGLCPWPPQPVAHPHTVGKRRLDAQRLTLPPCTAVGWKVRLLDLLPHCRPRAPAKNHMTTHHMPRERAQISCSTWNMRRERGRRQPRQQPQPERPAPFTAEQNGLPSRDHGVQLAWIV